MSLNFSSVCQQPHSVPCSFSPEYDSLTESVFTFEVKPRCSSTRMHQLSKIVLLISGIPLLSKPLVSVPITLRARALQRRHSPQGSTLGDEEALVPLPAPLPLPETVAITCTEFSPLPSNSPCPITGKIPTMPTVNSQTDFLPPAVLAISPLSLNIPLSAVLAGPCVMYRKRVLYSSLLTFQGPVVLIAIVSLKTPFKYPHPPMSPGIRKFMQPLSGPFSTLFGCKKQKDPLHYFA